MVSIEDMARVLRDPRRGFRIPSLPAVIGSAHAVSWADVRTGDRQALRLRRMHVKRVGDRVRLLKITNSGLVATDVETRIRNARNPYRIGRICILWRTCSPQNKRETIDVVSARRRITMIYQGLAKVFLICSNPSQHSSRRDRDHGQDASEKDSTAPARNRQRRRQGFRSYL
jgi:hypothetical protein